MRTIQPTEPILAYNAAHEFVSSCFEGKLKKKKEKYGRCGRMVAALILMFAYDEKQFDILPPKPLSKQMTRHTSRIYKAQGTDDDSNQSNYVWPQK